MHLVTYVMCADTRQMLGVWVSNEANDPKHRSKITHYVYRRPDGKLRRVHISKAEKFSRYEYN